MLFVQTFWLRTQNVFAKVGAPCFCMNHVKEENQGLREDTRGTVTGNVSTSSQVALRGMNSVYSSKFRLEEDWPETSHLLFKDLVLRESLAHRLYPVTTENHPGGGKFNFLLCSYDMRVSAVQPVPVNTTLSAGLLQLTLVAVKCICSIGYGHTLVTWH